MAKKIILDRIELPPEVYPAFKKALIEAARDFISAFVVVFGTQIALGIDWENPWAWLSSALIAGGKAGLRGVAKYLREKIGQGDYSKAVYKWTAILG